MPETDEVYTVGFAPDETFQKFIDKMKQKSYDDTGVNVTKDDHIMTLSTCSTTGKRFVVHAVRIGEIEKEQHKEKNNEKTRRIESYADRDVQ